MSLGIRNALGNTPIVKTHISMTFGIMDWENDRAKEKNWTRIGSSLDLY